MCIFKQAPEVNLKQVVSWSHILDPLELQLSGDGGGYCGEGAVAEDMPGEIRVRFCR